MSVHKVLIANRGEIAVRIARACAAYGVGSVAVYSDQDAEALHVAAADEAVPLEGTSLADTYLSIEKLLDAALRTGADAVHPGYGFLSENPDFARAVAAAGLTWIGPAADVIELLGDKIAAHRLARDAGAPLVPGTDGPVAGPAEAVSFAREHGLPVVVKAAAGGGGMGIRVARTLDEIPAAFGAAQREARAAFGRGDCFVERYLEHSRHIEAQVIGDRPGHVLVVGTRDCSLQRRGQKLVEEAPAPFLPAGAEQAVMDAARRICERAGYTSAGTVEFLVDRDGSVAFLEVNTRIQVEHGVTEETTGVDLVRQQLLVADGHPLDFDRAPAPHGHAIEFRITAEDPARGFLPEPGTLRRFDLPGGPGVRVDAGVAAGCAVPAEYDSLIAKLVVWGADRDEAIRRSRQALAEFRIEGVGDILPFHRRLLDEEAFTAPRGTPRIHTRWLEEECEWKDHLAPGLGDEQRPATPVRTWVEIDGVRHRVGLPAGFALAGAASSSSASGVAVEPEPGSLLAPVSGTLSSWRRADGDLVAAGEQVALIEAMKLETPVAAEIAGRLRIEVPAGGSCRAGDVLGHVVAEAS
jgi:acetyl-CoA/propionyl-CoA carboxylase biotin carboxyl carrier protein